MAERNRPHLVVPNPAITEAYRPPARRMEPKPLPRPTNRRAHALRLRRELEQAARDAAVRRASAGFLVSGSVDGFYLSFDSGPGLQLALESLDSRVGKIHPELVSVHQVQTPAGIVERAVVFVPTGKLSTFLKRVQAYADTAGDLNPKNQNLVDRVQAIRLATIEALWTDPVDEFPAPGVRIWWEVWLRQRDGLEVERFQEFAEQTGFDVRGRTLGFGNRTVVLALASVDQLATAVDVLDDLAELRRAHDLAQLIADEAPAEQREWIEQLEGRTREAPTDAPAVTVVDTGVHQSHPLLAKSLDPSDCHACEAPWGTHDHDGHGTQMAGLALYGELGAVVLSSGPVVLRHRLESVKLLPPGTVGTPPELYGAITATAASVAEIHAPDRRRVFSVAVTAVDRPTDTSDGPASDLGQPTSWSAAIDALAAGRSVVTSDDGLVYLDNPDVHAHRLFIVSAGNVTRIEDDYLTRSDLEPVQDPGQAWNALTVGAFTQLDSLATAGAAWQGYTAIAPRDELSPFSRTSVAFKPIWPAKPEVLFEGGNVARSPDGSVYDTPSQFQVLTTKAPLGDSRLLTTSNATSAATAQAAHLAASIMATYPEFWPETVRALVVHSAQWTRPMESRLRTAQRASGKVAALRALHRRYGMGVPDLGRATRSASDSLTLIVQDTIRPYHDGKLREMHLHDLPWPTDVLADLGSATVRMRVTLSYFVEPNPARRGWVRRYSYASHGLRFDVRRPTESMDEFRQRINQLALAEEERRQSAPPDPGWVFGTAMRTTGSLHTDIWEGSAVALASRGALAVFPIAGWWKENAKLDRSEEGGRYALVVSIETPEQDVDVWTPVAQQIGIPVTVEV